MQQTLSVTCACMINFSGRMRLPDLQHARSFVPVAIAMVTALVAYRWSLLSVSVSFTHIIKTLGPLFTIGFSRLLLQERTPASSCLSIVPVAVGVAITSATEAEFALVGFLAALLSTAMGALQMVLAKRLMAHGSVLKADLFLTLAVYSLLLLLPLVLYDARQWPAIGWRRPLAALHWLILNGVCSFVNQYTALSVLDAMESPLSHALANVLKRAAVITIAMTYTGRPVTPLHIFGVALSVFGAFFYQQASRCGKEASSGYELLPLTRSQPTGAVDRGDASPGRGGVVPSRASADNSPESGSDDASGADCQHADTGVDKRHPSR